MWNQELRYYISLVITAQPSRKWDLPHLQPNCLNAHIQQRAYPILLRPPIAQTVNRWYRNINLLSIAYAFRPRLRSRLTLSRLALLRNPWAFGGGVSHSSFVTYACILTSPRSTGACRCRFTARGTLSYRSVKDEAHSFGGWLEPRYIIRARALDQ